MGLRKVAGGLKLRSPKATPTYKCQGCREEFDIEFYRCPSCGSYRVDRANWVVD